MMAVEEDDDEFKYTDLVFWESDIENDNVVVSARVTVAIIVLGVSVFGVAIGVNLWDSLLVGLATGSVWVAAEVLAMIAADE